ncbi:MAG: PAS domain S-box protein [Oscillochloris sp.]|nr:PAS domain S-box protein [Oscillochloris sp.]
MSSLTGASPQPPIESRHNGLRRIFVRFAPWVALTAAAVLLSGTAFGMPLIPVAAVLLGALYCSLGANIGIAIAAGLFYGLLSLGVAEPAWFEWIAMYLLSLGLAGLLWQQRNQLRQRVAAGEAELERAQSEKQAMLAAVMTMPIGMTFSSPDDAQFTVRYANPAFGAISGYPPEALIGYDFRMLFGPDSDPTAVKRLQAALHERRATQAVLCLQGGDGRSFWSDIALAPVYMPNGNFVGMISLYQDISARRADEERLQILERQIKLILRTIPEQFWLKDCAGRYLLVSEALAQFHGLSSDAMIGRTATELYPANLADFITAGDKHVFEYGQNYYAERLISGPDGQQYWFDSSRTPVYDDNSKLIGLVGLARDISRRKANEANLARQLRYAEALARCSQVLLASSTAAEDLAANVTDAIAELRSALDVSRVVVYQYSSLEANAQMSCLAATVAPHDPEPLLVPVTWGEAPPELIAALHARRAFGGPTAGRYRDYPQFQAMFDRNMILSWLAVPIFLGERLWGHIGVSERREPCEWDSPLVQFLNTAAEMIASFVRRLETLEALQQRESHLRAVRDAMPDPLFTLHADGRLSDLHLTPDSRLVAEAERHEILSIDHLIADTSVQILRQAATAACRSNAVQQCELHAGSPADQAIYEARLAPINATEVLVVIRDVTERERVAEQLRHAATVAAAADRAKSAFLAHMSHEIRTPLNAVIGMAELLRESSLPAETQAALETIMIGGETLLGLVNDILDLARIEAGHLDIDRKPFDIRGAIESSALLIRQKAEEKGLDLRITIAPALPHYVLGDAMRLRQILVNLLANAIKFTPGGYVAIEARYQADTGEMSILVSDSGIGIASDQLEAIFAPLYRMKARPVSARAAQAWV